MKNEFFFPDRLKIIYEQMMNNAVAEISGENFPWLGFCNDETDGFSRLIRAVFKLFFQF